MSFRDKLTSRDLAVAPMAERFTPQFPFDSSGINNELLQTISTVIELGISPSLLRRRHGEEAVSMAAGIGVLANNGSAGIYAHRDGSDGVEWRRARNVKRYRRRSVRKLKKPVLFSRAVLVGSHHFLARIDVPSDRLSTIGDIVWLKDAVLQHVSVLVVSHHVNVEAHHSVAVGSRAAMHGVWKGLARISQLTASHCEAGIPETRPSGREHGSHHVEIMEATVHVAVWRDAPRYSPWMAGE